MNAYWLSKRQSNDQHVFQENRTAKNWGRSDILHQKWTFFHNGTIQAWTPYVRENSKCEASLSLAFLFKEGGWNKKLTWFSHLSIFLNQEQTAEERVSCDSLPLPNLLHSCFFRSMPFFFGFPHYTLLVYGTTACSTGLPGTPLGAVYLTHTRKTNFKFLLCNNSSS